MIVAILGRQPEISFAELEAVFGRDKTTLVSQSTALIDVDSIDIALLGGTVKVGKVVHRDPIARSADKDILSAVSRLIVSEYSAKWHSVDHKITLGISAYNLKVSPRDVQKTGLVLKSRLKRSGVSLRLIPNSEPDLSTATAHNNKLGLSPNKVELMIIKTDTEILVAQSLGAQNITAYAKRDHAKPKRDAFVGMLPPKLAQIMLNLAVGETQSTPTLTILDPFCGTGTVLQEALLRNYSVMGSDLSEKMVDYTRSNLDWIKSTHKSTGHTHSLTVADAMTHSWTDADKISAVVCETYLGQPFSAPPSPGKLKEVSRNCNHIISQFLANIHPQLAPGTPLCIAVPAWRGKDGRLTHLPLSKSTEKFGFKSTRHNLVYSRPDQVVTREILTLVKSA